MYRFVCIVYLTLARLRKLFPDRLILSGILALLYLLFVICYLLVVGCWLLLVGGWWLVVVGWLFLTFNYSLLIDKVGWAEINALQTPREERLSFPRRRESKAYWRKTKSAINYVHLLKVGWAKKITHFPIYDGGILPTLQSLFIQVGWAKKITHFPIYHRIILPTLQSH